MGGVLALFATLALSLLFASCANNSNSDDESPSPSLPANVGENPIEKTIKLKPESDNSNLELRPDGTALYGYDDEPWAKFNYAYDADAKKIYMQVEKASLYNDDWISHEDALTLMTYNEIISRINKDYTLDNIKEIIESEYKDKGDKFSSYEDFEKNWYEEAGFDSLKDLLECSKQEEKAYYKAIFGAQVTYAYKIDSDGKMTLTEKFTGVKNMLYSSTYYDSSSGTRCYIYSDWANFYEYNDGEWEYYYGIPDTDKKTIDFRANDGSIVNATYTENLSEETVTIKFKDKEYVCKFEGQKFIEE